MAGTRFQQKQQRRRQNGVLNIAIGIVLLAVVIVAYQLFFTSDNTEQVASSDKKVAQQTEKEKEAAKKTEKEEAAKKKAEEQKKKEEEAKKKAEEEAKAKENEKVPAEKTMANATEAYTKPGWKPVGTEQGQSPAMTFQKGSTDWNEMMKAIGYAIDIPADQLVIHRIGNNGKQKAYGNVQDKQTGKKYYVNIDWVENEGWKPTLVQVLN
jgi:hypothetical protein